MKPITDAYRAILASENAEKFEPKTGAEHIAFQVYQQAKEGRLRHAKEITDRVEGRITLPVAGSDDAEVTPESERLDFSALSDDELHLLGELLSKGKKEPARA